ncbi:PHD finger protein 3 isoform X2 [Echinops telfairi]|uniref:PHD finger protein 3 isoform X2 n=1 Tax=Echinops telfairi TaxID=9371 RepID=A0AC55DG59_ECHTE|nr:PHD finger protein 3 isoform X2 [Echinops telfairi]
MVFFLSFYRAERHTEVFMDIVDTFNHLIPTEHLDDALFLGSNLENEVCEDFSSSQNVLEDSLKNMLSDKDPMLGSASNQFCLPVLDSNDPNVQMPCSTEQVRSLRQSTIAKRSNAAPLSSTKKASGKTLSSPKAGVRQPERCQIKEEVCASPNIECHKERRSSRHIGQMEVVPAVSVSSGHSSVSPCLELKDEAGLDSLNKCNNQGEANVPSHELNCSLLSETCVSIEERKNEAPMEYKIKLVRSPLFKFSDKEEHEEKDSVSDRMHDIVEEMRTEGKLEQESKGTVKSHGGDQIVEEPGSFGDTAYTNPNKAKKSLEGLSASVGEATECNLELKNTIETDDNQSQSAELNKSDLEMVDTTAFEPESNILENALCDAPDQNLQLHAESIKMEPHEITDLQDDRNGQSSSVSYVESKNMKSKHMKSAIHSKQNMTTDTPKKIVATKLEIMHNKNKINVNSVKRNADEPESQQNFHRPAKVRKKQDNKDLKIQSSSSGARSVKNQSHLVFKKVPQDQHSVLMSKPIAQSLSDKPHGHPTYTKEPHHPAQTGHLSHSSQKPQQQVPAMKSNSHVKEGHEYAGAEHFKEEDKLKQKKPEKHLQPRQRRSSKSFSLDEPPLFIPDNIATVKREGSEHSSSFESKYIWTPSKQCGFCKKPHGNRFMVGCGRCDDWFHGDCVGLSLSQAQQMGEEDKEYVCVKCCAEEDKKTEVLDPDLLENQAKVEIHSEDKTMDGEKLGLSKHTSAHEKNKYIDDTVKHKVKILKRECGESKSSSECRDSEIKKWQLAPVRKTGQPVLSRKSSEEKSEKVAKESTTVICTGEKTSKPGAHEKSEIKKKKVDKGGVPNVHPATGPASKPSADQIRQSVRHSLKDILMKRLTDSNLKVPEEKAAKVATKIEKELFSFFRDTDAKYKNKYRSLMFNLKDPKNNILFKKVLKGEVTPDHLIRMSPEELASKELAAWRRRENRHTIEMIEKEQREVERRPITKITHKGEIEIESDAPMKEQEAATEIQESTANKSLEKIEEPEKQKEDIDSMSKDTTSQHRQHLFDLNCKICIGRMAPPIDDLSPKKVKVVVGVSRKHSDNEAESIADALSSTSNILASEFFEDEKQESPKSTFSPAPRLEMPGTVEVESTFLARLNFIWKGFINMPSVAKFVTKAYPVSGSPEYLTEDLPDSIQVGGRISPQTVWDYVEKIKASGTKEICVVRFTPVTEEDQISYTLLFAYFSSRKRYGVAANNMKQVKDMYLIPLGATDKIPHPLVPFDGPGLELHRPNLLLGLIIRQKLKRQHSASASTSHTAEAPENVPAALPPDKKCKMEVSPEEAPEEENDFFNSFTTVLHKQRNKPQPTIQEDLPTAVEPLLEITKQEPPKPLRFLPGVLIGWESQPTTLELANKPLPVDDILQSLLGSTGQVYEQAQPMMEQNIIKEIPFINEQTNSKAENTDKMEVPDDEAKEVKVSIDNHSEATDNSVVVVEEETSVLGSSPTSLGPLTNLSLRGKPPDISTEAFLANLSIQSKQEEAVESKERTLKSQLLQDQENTSQDNWTSNSGSPGRANVGKGNADGSVSCSDSLIANPARSPQFINLKRDPRQAAGRTQQLSSTENKDGDSGQNGEKHTLPGLPQKEHLTEETNIEEKLPSVEKTAGVQHNDNSSAPQNSSSIENEHTSQTEKTKPLQEDILMQNIETAHPLRRGSAATTAHYEVGSTCQSEFPSKSITFTSRSTSPRTNVNFSPIRPQQPSLQHLKSSPPAFPFPGPPNFPPQNMFGFPPHLPPPLLPPPGFGFPQNPMVPWPPVVHLSGQPQRMLGPLSQATRYIGPQNFYQVKDIRRPERRHSDPWGRQDQQQLDRAFNRGKGDRQRFHSDSHHLRRERYEKEWEPDSERHRRRDRGQDKDRDRKGREEGHKERARLSHGDRGADGKASRESRNVEKKPDKPKSEDHEKDKEREKSKHREGEKDRDRYHKDRDHTDRAKSKR